MTDSTPPPPEQPQQPAGQPAGSSSTNPNTMATIAHAVVVTGFLIPLIIWLVGKDQSQFTDTEGKKALNFGILVSIGYFASVILSVIPIIGWILSPLLWLGTVVVALIFGIQGAMAANKGQAYKYPFNLNLVK
ncbi:DUF4870 domain-containing protein [Demequina oxidasica]|uniref:DUF4870 domain-containing protein n=1 Tax=Demequina oxidasica TaxID=676199 RepID=UPI0007837D52|nr:DUF4870 domain-containing protein [Demequina oxidasica]